MSIASSSLAIVEIPSENQHDRYDVRPIATLPPSIDTIGSSSTAAEFVKLLSQSKSPACLHSSSSGVKRPRGRPVKERKDEVVNRPRGRPKSVKSVDENTKTNIAMETGLGSLLKILPPVDFCCVYGSSLHPNNNDKSSMEDYILGVSDPQQWHSENLKRNRDHYASWMVPLGGGRLITKVADHIGVGVHYNPFVSWNDKMYKYGVVHMEDLVQDMVNWDRFYLSGRLQKPVRILVDKMEIENVNLVNLRAASSAALLLLPSKFTETELYAKICSLSYTGDLRMLFAEDKNKVKKIVEGQFELFRSMYKPLVEEYAKKELLRFSSFGDHQVNISQDCGLSATSSLVSSLPAPVRSHVGKTFEQTGQNVNEIAMGSREEAAVRMQKVLRRKVMISSARQAVAGLITVGAVHGIRYLGKKMNKAWKSWTQ